MKYLNLIALFVGVLVVVNIQGPSADSDRTIDIMNIVGGQEIIPIGGGGANCPYSGYDSISCATILTPGCTAGSFQAPLSGVGLPNLFQTTGTTSVRGECIGNANCETPPTDDLTSAGC